MANNLLFCKILIYIFIMKQISEGDVVCLKSDLYNDFPQKMTVEDIDYENGTCYCVWFYNGEVRKETFSIQSLARC